MPDECAGQVYAGQLPQRCREIDILRSGAIALILLAHLPAYVRAPWLGDCEMYLVTLGLSVFIFISGFAIDMNNTGIGNRRDMLRFLWKRAVRIYPLYVPALVLFVVLFHYRGLYHKAAFSPVPLNLLVHLLGAQVLASPKMTPMFTLWFVGLIVPYYVVYVLLARYTRSMRGLIANGLV